MVTRVIDKEMPEAPKWPEELCSKTVKAVVKDRDDLLTLFQKNPKLQSNGKTPGWIEDLLGKNATGIVIWAIALENYRQMARTHLRVLRATSGDVNEYLKTSNAITKQLQTLANLERQIYKWDVEKKGKKSLNIFVVGGRKLYKLHLKYSDGSAESIENTWRNPEHKTLIVRSKPENGLPELGTLYSTLVMRGQGGACNNFGFKEQVIMGKLIDSLTRLYNVQVMQWDMSGDMFTLTPFIPLNKLSEQEAITRSNLFYQNKKKKRVFTPEGLNDLSKFMNHLERNFTRNWVTEFGRTSTNGKVFCERRFLSSVQDPRTLALSMHGERLRRTRMKLELIGIDTTPVSESAYVSRFANGTLKFVKRIGGCNGRNGIRRVKMNDIMNWIHNHIARQQAVYGINPKTGLGNGITRTVNENNVEYNTRFRHEMETWTMATIRIAFLFDGWYRWQRKNITDIEGDEESNDTS